jgi:MFS family permease
MKVSKRFTLLVILASALLTVMAGSMLGPVVNLVREGLGVDPASVGLIVTTHSLFVAIFSPLAGALVDRIGTRRPFLYGLVLYGLAGGSGLFIDSYWLLIASRALLGIAVAAILNSVTVSILSLYEGPERNKIMGWRGSANSFGAMLFPLLGGGLGNISWHLPFAVYLVGLPIGLLAFIAMPEVYRGKPRDTSDGFSALRVFRDNPVLLAIYSLSFLAMVILYAGQVFLPQLLETIGIVNPFYISLYFATASLSSALTALAYGKIKSRLSYKSVALLILALWAVGLIGISQAASGWVVVVSMVLIGMGRGMVIPAAAVWASETVPASFRGRIIAYLTTLGYVGQFSSPLLFQPVFLWLGFNGVFLVASVVCALVFLLFLGLVKR